VHDLGAMRRRQRLGRRDRHRRHHRPLDLEAARSRARQHVLHGDVAAHATRQHHHVLTLGFDRQRRHDLIAGERDHPVGLAALQQLAMKARLGEQARIDDERAQVALPFALRAMHSAVHPHGEPLAQNDSCDDALCRSHRSHYINAPAQPPSQATLIRTHGSANK
jgi:hypothetical protein